MAILKKHQRLTFTVVDNSAIRDPRLSWKATGLLVFLLGQSDGYKVSVAGLTKSKSDGRDAVSTGLSELEAAGYVRRRRIRNGKGQLQTLIDVAESPELFAALDSPTTDFPASDNHQKLPEKAAGLPTTDNPTSEKPTTDNPQKKSPKPTGLPTADFPASAEPTTGKPIDGFSVTKKEQAESARAVIDEEALRALALERAVRKGAHNPEGLASKILAEDRADLIGELARRREATAKASALEVCTECDERGFRWIDDDTAMPCDHQAALDTVVA